MLDAGARGPFVLAGTFAVELQAGDTRQTAQLEVLPDPLVPVTAEERAARYRFTMQLYELQQVGYDRGVEAYELQQRSREALDSLLAKEDVPESDSLAADSLVSEIGRVADDWRGRNSDVRNWWTGLIGKFDGGPSTTGSLTGPSDSQQRRLAAVRDQFDQAATDLDAWGGDALSELNEILTRHGVDSVEPPGS